MFWHKNCVEDSQKWPAKENISSAPAILNYIFKWEEGKLLFITCIRNSCLASPGMPHEWLERWCQSKHHSKSAKGKEKSFLLLCFVLDYVQEDASLHYSCQSVSCILPVCSLEMDTCPSWPCWSSLETSNTFREETVVFKTLLWWKVKQSRETADPCRLARCNTETKII